MGINEMPSLIYDAIKSIPITADLLNTGSVFAGGYPTIDEII